ncbi:MAG TPA: class I tRNA ligase family protein, partial [Candidatus Binataceae bacterium]|nr:class I tRNA ligase family protein [Candidatus Binataceae bacterium]
QGVVWATDGQRMSKSKGNVVTPDAMIEKYGADALRLWELFMCPFDEDTRWNEDGVAGTQRFIVRVWSWVRRYAEAGCPGGVPSEETIHRAHKTLRIVTGDVEQMRFNTALAAMMEHLNHVAKLEPDKLNRFVVESFVLMLAPMAPYAGEELWRALGHQTSVHREAWPVFDPALAREHSVIVVVQVNGKVRERLQVGAGASEDEVKSLAMKSEAVAKHLGGKSPRKFIFIPDKMLSIVA